MGSADIQAKIKRGLAKAVNKTGSSSSELVYLVKKTNTGGNTPLDPPTVTSDDVLLVNAIFKSYNQKMIGGNIIAGDRQLVSDDLVAIEAGNTIKQGGTIYTVIDTNVKAPTSDALVYISQVRVK